LFKFITLSYHCSILVGGYSDFINFLLIIPFFLSLNSSTNGCSLYSLSFTAYLNFCMNSIILFSYSTFFNSVTFIVSLSPSLNFFFRSIKNFPTVIYSNSLFSKFFTIFFFQIFTDLPYIYDNIYCICSFTELFPIFILIKSLHAVRKPCLSLCWMLVV